MIKKLMFKSISRISTKNKVLFLDRTTSLENKDTGERIILESIWLSDSSMFFYVQIFNLV